jgi:hypothetical protein
LAATSAVAPADGGPAIVIAAFSFRNEIAEIVSDLHAQIVEHHAFAWREVTLAAFDADGAVIRCQLAHDLAGAKLTVLLDDLSPLSARGAEAQSPFHPRPKMTTMSLAHAAALVLLTWRPLFRPLRRHFSGFSALHNIDF